MARRTRSKIFYDGCFGHVYTRALQHWRVFESREDFEKMRELLVVLKERYRFRIHHYCLMNTHFHLLVSMDSVELFAKGMKESKRLYANWLHGKKKTFGPVWWGRYGSQVIEDERYLGACGIYIERNPVDAGMVARPEDWEYSSARHYLTGNRDTLIDTYDQPSIEAASQLLKTITVGKGSVIGTELFHIHSMDNVSSKV